MAKYPARVVAVGAVVAALVVATIVVAVFSQRSGTTTEPPVTTSTTSGTTPTTTTSTASVIIPPTIELVGSTQPVLSGDDFALAGRIEGAVLRPFVVQQADPSTTDWTTVEGTDGTTTETGDYEVTLTAGLTYSYRILVPATATDAELTSDTLTVATVSEGWRQVSNGWGHSCGIWSDGTLWCWGVGMGVVVAGAPNLGSWLPNPVPIQVKAPVAGTTWVSVTSADGHNCGILSDRTLWCWGTNQSGKLGIGTEVEVKRRPTQVIVRGAAQSWLMVSAAGDHTCGIRPNHTLWCWGSNKYGELGVAARVGTYKGIAMPTQVQATGTDQTWLTVSAGWWHTCAMRSDRTLWCWGRNNFGQLGTDVKAGKDKAASPEPTQVQTSDQAGTPGDGQTWVTVTAGYDQTCGIRSDRTLWCWGNNNSAQLGNETNVRREKPNPTPTEVGEPDREEGWLTVALGRGHTCGLQSDHTLWCWGANYAGQLGTATNSGTEKANPTPTQVIGRAKKQTWSAVAAGSGHTCAIRLDHTMWCWGDNAFGQLGNKTNAGTAKANRTPLQVSQPGASTSPSAGTAAWRQVSGGEQHTCAILDNQTLWCWGLNRYGNLGTTKHSGTVIPTPRPTKVRAAGVGQTWLQVSAGATHTCAIRANHTLWCWGSNRWGELGNATNKGTNKANPTPTQVIATGTDQTWLAASAGGSHTCGIRADHTLWCWGANYAGQLGTDTNAGTEKANPTPTQVIATGTVQTWVSVSAGSDHTCGIRTNHTLWCWGANYRGQLGTDINAGEYDSANPKPTKVLADGTVQTWLSVSAGNDHTCGIRTNHTLWCWGSNFHGALGNNINTEDTIKGPTVPPNPTPAKVRVTGTLQTWLEVGTAGDTCAIRTDDSLWCWGANSSGQLGNSTDAGPWYGYVWTPTKVRSSGTPRSWTDVATGGAHTCAITPDNTLWCWGSNYQGQLGTSTNTFFWTAKPAPVLDPG